MTRLTNELPLFHSNGGVDALSDVKDMQLLLENLQDHMHICLYGNDYAHANYVMAQNAKQYVYEPLVSFLKLQSYLKNIQ